MATQAMPTPAASPDTQVHLVIDVQFLRHFRNFLDFHSVIGAPKRRNGQVTTDLYKISTVSPLRYVKSLAAARTNLKINGFARVGAARQAFSN